MSTATETQGAKPDPKPVPPVPPKPHKAGASIYPFAPVEPEKSEAQQKEAELEKAYDAYRAKVAESDGRSIPSFDQLSVTDRQDFASGGKLLQAEVGPAPSGIHARRNAQGLVVLVTRDNRPIYVASAPVKGQPPATPGLSLDAIPAGNATPYGNFTIEDGAWAYKGARLYTSTTPVAADSGFTEALA